MKNELEIVNFIKEHLNWEDILTQKPYSLIISRDTWNGRNLIMFKYNMIDSDFHERICCEARGIVLDEDTLEVISYGFDKFFNSHEQFAADIDANSMISTVKIDGSIIKIVRIGNSFLISSNGTINAFSAPVAEQIGCPFKSFGEIVNQVIIDKFVDTSKFVDVMKEGYTYIFELVSPWTRVCTPFDHNDMYLIGCRCNDPSQGYHEIFFNDCSIAKYFKTPDILKFNTIEKCLEYAQTLDWTNEGFVVMDKNFNRVKVKNASWLAVHHLASNHTMSYERAIEICRANEIDEVLGYFPEFKDALLDCKERYEKLIDDLESAWMRYDDSVLETRKDKAIWIQKNFRIPGVGFALIDKKVDSIQEWIKTVPVKNLVKHLGYKE